MWEEIRQRKFVRGNLSEGGEEEEEESESESELVLKTKNPNQRFGNYW